MGQDEAWTKLLTLNLQRVFLLTQKCLPLLRAAAEQGGKADGAYNNPARIINVRLASSSNLLRMLMSAQIGSIEGTHWVPAHETYAYAASKAGLHSLSRNLAGRLGPEGITSNTLACGESPVITTA